MAEPNYFELELARACVSRYPQALATFEREVLSTVDRALARMNLGARIEDVKQRMRARS